MEIIEHTPNYPITILGAERYAYYKECELKSELTDKQIREEAIKMFKEWTKNPDFKVEITMLPLLKTFKYSHKASFFAEWYRDRCYGLKEMECPRFVFEKSLNDAVNEFVSVAYKEHRQELENEFCARTSKRQKSYQRLGKTCVFQWVAIAILIIGLIITLAI